MQIDPNVPRKKSLLEKGLESRSSRGDGFPLFSLFELDITDLCNRSCEFCPRANRKEFPNRGNFMPAELQGKLMTELGSLKYDGIIAYSGFSEPLLHKDLNEMIATARRCCPMARIELYTNGDVLDSGRLRELFKAGLSSIHISLYDGPGQRAGFSAMLDAAGVGADRFFLRDRFLTRDEGYGLTISNRAGTVDFEKTGMTRLKAPMNHQCYYPFYMMMVHYTGQALMCSHDWGRKLILGDLNSSSIQKVWKGEAAENARRKLAAADRNFPPCEACDVKGTLMGGGHFRKWKSLRTEKKGE